MGKDAKTMPKENYKNIFSFGEKGEVDDDDHRHSSTKK